MGELLSLLSVVTILASGVALVAGVLLIKRGERAWHMRAMLTASGLATVFLVFYLWRIGLGYEKVYVGPDQWRTPYYVMLASHIILAALNLPLAIVAVWNAWKGLRAAGDLGRIHAVPEADRRFRTHRAWVRFAVPVWLYVAATGWAIYFVMEHWGELRG